MNKLPILSRTNFNVYWNNIKQPDTLCFTLNDAIIQANNVFNNGIFCPKNEVHILSSLGCKYIHLGNGQYQIKSN